MSEIRNFFRRGLAVPISVVMFSGLVIHCLGYKHAAEMMETWGLLITIGVYVVLE